MTKTEAHELLKIYVRNTRGELQEALIIALKALAWECVHEKMLGITVLETSETKEGAEEQTNAN